MSLLLGDVVRFRGDRLFNGAVNIDWFSTDEDRTRAASAAFVFHGPRYHGVQQEDVGAAHGHALIDTASLTQAVVRQCLGGKSDPFTLAIAGYGTGKSHFGLTLARLLSDPDSEDAEAILASLTAADTSIGNSVRSLLEEARQPCLVLALNGMQSFDLTAELTRQVVHSLRARGLDTRPIEDLRPRFSQAASLIRMSHAELVKELLQACETEHVDDLLLRLGQQDEVTYVAVHDFFAARGMAIRALAGESVRDVITLAAREYCGDGRPYRSLVILFDEFGRYTEFATVRSHVAGSGALQDLFEVIQANEGVASFVGFIQFELNAYVQRIAPEYRNEVLRYVTRYQTARKVYLSINLETLIASLIEKRRPDVLEKRLGGDPQRHESLEIMTVLARWYPQARNHRLWQDAEQFHTVIRKGCWPISPFSTWFLFYLASGGKHLQERSALALLGEALARHQAGDLPARSTWALAPVELWSNDLQQELLSSEESGQQGAVAHAFASVTARHGGRLTDDQLRVLQAVVLASKMGLQASGRDDAVAALAQLAGLLVPAAASAIAALQDEYNVLEWDEAFKEYGILGDAVPRTQFLAFVRHRVASSYDEGGKARLFASRAALWCDLLGDLECDFAEEHRITTREWRFQSVTSNLEQLAAQIALARNQWLGAFGVDEARGTVIYCYVEPSRDAEQVASDASKMLRSGAKEAGVPLLPMVVVLLHDRDGALGQTLAELAVLEESLSAEDRVRFGNLIPAHQEKLRQILRDALEARIKDRRYVTGLQQELESHRLSRAGTEVFKRAYRSTIPFPFDGFSTARGNAADTCQELTSELLAGRLDFQGVIAKPVKTKNRAVTVLKEAWGIFAKNGEVSRRPSHAGVRAVTERWDQLLTENAQRLPVGDALKALCLPPYGANIASAGLILGVFVAPRVEGLAIVQNGVQLAVSQWAQDNLFRNKVINLAGLSGVDLVAIGEASSEWETLLDEWEQASSYLARCECLKSATALKNRVPVPPLLAYREAHYREEAARAMSTLASMERELDGAIEKMEQGIFREDVAQIVWGGSHLKRLIDKMASEKPSWTDAQIEVVQPRYGRARQAAIQLMPTWLPQQTMKSDAPEVVGDFKHKMLNLIGKNLRSMGLETEYQLLQAHVALAIRRAETIATAHQLVRDVESWLGGHGAALHLVRVADLRALRETGRNYGAKLQGMAERVDLHDIGRTKVQLSSFLGHLKDVEAEVMKRGAAVWKKQLRSEDDIEPLLAEIESLVSIFEGLPGDQEDYILMRRSLRSYQKDYQALADERLSWSEFEQLAERLRVDAVTGLGESELPWPPEETIGAFVDTLSRLRKKTSAAWIDALEEEAAGAPEMTVADVSRLHERACNSPAVLTSADATRGVKVVKVLEKRLDSLKVEWLWEKFKELPPTLRKAFLGLVKERS